MSLGLLWKSLKLLDISGCLWGCIEGLLNYWISLGVFWVALDVFEIIGYFYVALDIFEILGYLCRSLEIFEDPWVSQISFGVLENCISSNFLI